MKTPKQLIICGNGPSLNEGIDTNLWDILKNRFTIGMNFIYRDFEPTVLTYIDAWFYNGYQGKEKHRWKDTEERRLEHIEKLKQVPFIVGQDHNDIKEGLPNTLLLKTGETYYGRKSINYNSMYRANLCGIFALTLGVCLLDEGEIYLCGYDGGPLAWIDEKTPYTHFSQTHSNAIKHRGFSQISYYNDHHEERDFGVYKDDPKIKIYNVSLASHIPDTIFQKISYTELYKCLSDAENHSQSSLRSYFRDFIVKEKAEHAN